MKLVLPVLLLLLARPLPAQEACALDHVIDGDTFKCQDGTRVRLLFVDAPEREQPGGASVIRAIVLRRSRYKEVLHDIEPVSSWNSESKLPGRVLMPAQPICPPSLAMDRNV